MYVSDDVDVGKAAAALADGAFYNTGQSCCSVERIYVNAKVTFYRDSAEISGVRRICEAFRERSEGLYDRKARGL